MRLRHRNMIQKRRALKVKYIQNKILRLLIQYNYYTCNHHEYCSHNLDDLVTIIKLKLILLKCLSWIFTFTNSIDCPYYGTDFFNWLFGQQLHRHFCCQFNHSSGWWTIDSFIDAVLLSHVIVWPSWHWNAHSITVWWEWCNMRRACHKVNDHCSFNLW